MTDSSRTAAGPGWTGVPREAPPTLPVPQEDIVCVEHPCIIKDLAKGIKSMGGQKAINKVPASPNHRPARGL
jgi:general transcription factor 3C polypeptide 5 (transcription factor C subunit 1)